MAAATNPSYLNQLLKDLSGLKLSSADYWDVRVEDSFETLISIVNGEVVSCTSSPALGAFVRVRKNGFWLYEATTDIPKIRDVLQKLDRQPMSNSSAHAFTPVKQPPFSAMTAVETRYSAVPLESKLTLAKKYSDLIRGLPKVASAEFIYKDLYKTKSYLNSAGTQFEFDFNQGGFRCRFTLKEGDKLFIDVCGAFGAKFSDLQNQETKIREFVAESETFLNAPAVEPGKYRVLLDPEVAGVFTHESFGHKSEADFMLGNDEALKEWELGKKIGADCLTIVDYGGHPNSSGYCPVDDEGVPARKNYLIKNGVLTGRLHSQTTARQLNEEPTGNARAMNFEWEPIVRMTSTYIEPGTESLDSIMKKSEGALLVKGLKHGSGLSTFTIAPLRGYRIGKNGTKEPVRLTVISGSVFETLKNVEAVSSNFVLHSSAIGGCGKMEQAPLPVADGGPYVLIKEMQVS